MHSKSKGEMLGDGDGVNNQYGYAKKLKGSPALAGGGVYWWRFLRLFLVSKLR